MLYFSVTRRTKEITSLADSSKRRSSMRRKCAKEKSEITSTVEELNCLSSLCGLPTTSAEEVMSGDFVWSFNQCNIDSTTSHDIPVRFKAQIVDKYMLVKRLEEEKALLNMEMKNYMIYYLENVLPLLCERKKIKDRIGIQINVRIMLKQA
ncbi:uncharacterized protein LOC124453997 [Xenia sp. Carnegie-2017]|uniref:uncharacterized protein LOC124453997 n=1 Tax=Xenia sp. Carnegie-2017 TaxID=2897299 RepID=UPI001F03E58D|nr:uncharacterized protein LOC124453997 [Xenia sp. Carnegie-2017]